MMLHRVCIGRRNPLLAIPTCTTTLPMSWISAAVPSVPSYSATAHHTNSYPNRYLSTYQHTLKANNPNNNQSPRPASSPIPNASVPPKSSAPRTSSTPVMNRMSVPIPTLNAILKKFNLLVHPDLFTAYPTHAAANQASLQALNSLLTSLKTRNPQDSYPEKQVLKLIFHIKKKRGEEKWAEYVRTNDLETHLSKKPVSNRGGRPMRGHGAAGSSVSTLPPRGKDTLEGEFYIVPVVVSTNGSQCQRLVQSQLSSLFYRCGLPFKFNWDAEYWQMGAMRMREDYVQEEDGSDGKGFAENDAGYDEYEETENGQQKQQQNRSARS
jgi:hypothetical protein